MSELLVGRGETLPHEGNGERAELLEAGADGLAAGEAVVDALDDDGELEVAEGDVQAEAGDVGAGAGAVAVDELVGGEEPAHRGDGAGDRVVLDVEALPVDVEQAEVRERVAEGGHLPVQH